MDPSSALGSGRRPAYDLMDEDQDQDHSIPSDLRSLSSLLPRFLAEPDSASTAPSTPVDSSSAASSATTMRTPVWELPQGGNGMPPPFPNGLVYHHPPPPNINTLAYEGAFNDDSNDGPTIGLIRAETLVPGRGQPMHDAGVAFSGGKIEWVGSYSELPARYAHLSPVRLIFLMPGLWDCHTHYVGMDVVSSIDSMTAGYLPGSNAQVGAVTTLDLKRTLMAGYTSVRELGGYAGDVKPIVEMGAIAGPNIYSSHAALSITGGHGDDHNIPLHTVIEGMNNGGAAIAIADGVPECIKVVRTLIRRGASVIKVCSSGGVLSLNDDPEDRQFSDEELKAIVDEAGRSRRAVAAHAIGKAGIMAAIRAGVQSIEHGMYLDAECAALMKQKGIAFVATNHIMRTLAEEYLDTLDPRMQQKLLRVSARAKQAYELAVRKGLKIALGTDMISSDRSSSLSHGNNAKELMYALEAGMTPLQVIECATANGPETLGKMAPKSGQIKKDYDADFLGMAVSPLDNLQLLTHPSNISHVWKGGKMFKCPTRDVMAHY